MNKNRLKIDCYLSLTCLSEEDLKTNIKLAIEKEQREAEIKIHRINNDEALSLKLSGSPSIFINGKELQPLNMAGFS
ncbi:MAG: hypothetical protein HXY52_07415 [Nitrospirae bacterium]|jgi:protein-disulfide isomerase|nr:hypothetical protein [Nitrospirota bacterium]